MAWSYESASAACGDLRGIRSQNKDPVSFGVRQLGIPVLKHHDTLTGNIQCNRIAPWIVHRNGFILDVLVKKAETVECAEDIVHLGVDVLLLDDSGFNQRDEPFSCEIHSFRAFQVKSTVGSA